MITEIKVGDYIEKSELDTEQKYNDVVEVFGQWGFKRCVFHNGFSDANVNPLVVCDDGYCYTIDQRKRRLTYNDIMSLKRADWSKAPGATIYANGKFWKQNELATHFVDEFHLVSCSFLPTAATVDKLNGFEDFEINPDVNLLPYQKFKGESHGGIKLNPCNASEAHAKLNEIISKVKSEVKKDGKKYHREIIGFCGTKVEIDVYRVLDAYNTGSASIDHAIKKLLCTGLRGHKDFVTDIDNAIESLEEAKMLYLQKQEIDNN